MYSSHIFVRNGIYYYRADIPNDLQHYFPTSEIKHSLKTKDAKTAKVLAVSMEYKLQQTFCMIRTGMLPSDMISQVVSGVMPKKVKVAIPDVMLLSKVITQYVADKESGWTYKTKLEVVGCLRLIVDIIGNVEMMEITKQTVLDFRTRLIKLPANMYKCYPDKTVQAILDMPDVKPMSTNSVNKHIMRLNALLSYAVTEGVVTVNYAQGVMLSDKRKVDELRKVYSADDIQAIVDNLPKEQGRPERYWIPLIAMFSGMRLDEICQLYVEDVRQVDGVWCFNVNDDKDKKLKNSASKRVVPIHPVLVRCGFLQYADSVQKSAAPRLWMNLSWREADGYGNAMGNWYRRFNRKYVSKDDSKVFHSFRHTFTDTLKQCGQSETVIAELVGHSTSGSMTMGRYGKRYQPKVLLDALVQLDYGVQIPKWDM